MSDPREAHEDQPHQDRHLAAVESLRHDLRRLESLIRHGTSNGNSHGTPSTPGPSTRSSRPRLPAWQRPTQGELRLPVACAILLAIALQLLLPAHLAFEPFWLLPALELALCAALVATNPGRISPEYRLLRLVGLALTWLISLANAWSVVRLVHGLLVARAGEDPGPLLGSGGAIWATNVIAFALWYWEFDRGGPAARAQGGERLPDFQFAQMDSPALAPADWEPNFLDYLYLSFTNATAFSPTDVLPLSRWAKTMMMAQSVVSLVTVAVVVSRAVNLFK